MHFIYSVIDFFDWGIVLFKWNIIWNDIWIEQKQNAIIGPCQ